MRVVVSRETGRRKRRKKVNILENTDVTRVSLSCLIRGVESQ